MNDRAFRDRLVVTVAVLIAWQLAAVAFGAHWISPPLATARRVLELALNGELARHALYTLAAAAGGFILGGVPGGILPFVLRRAPRLAAVLDPYLVAAYGMPKLALAPLFILWFGIGLASKVTLVASIVFFLVFFSAAAGVRATDVRLVAMARVVGASERALARHVVFPAYAGMNRTAVAEPEHGAGRAAASGHARSECATLDMGPAGRFSR